VRVRGWRYGEEMTGEDDGTGYAGVVPGVGECVVTIRFCYI
jgi:hypothetical protein